MSLTVIWSLQNQLNSHLNVFKDNNSNYLLLGGK